MTSSIGGIRILKFKNYFVILFYVDVFKRKLGLICKLGLLIEYLLRNSSMEKLYRKHAIKTSAIAPFKVCVYYFLTNFYFSPNDSPSKTMEDVFYFI